MDAGRSQVGARGQTPKRADAGAGAPVSNRPATNTPITKRSSDASSTQTSPVSQVRNSSPAGLGGAGQPVLAAQADMAQAARGEILTDPQAIFDHGLGTNPQARENYQGLTKEQQGTFREMYMSQLPEGTEVNTAPQMGMGMGGMAGMGKGGGFGKSAQPSPEEIEKQKEQWLTGATRTHLVGLLGSGDLTATDSKGNTVLSNLDRLRTQETAESVDRGKLFQSTVMNLNQPTTSGAPSGGSQTAAELQKTIADQNPAEYSRVVAELATPEGRSQLGETTLQRGRDQQGELDGVMMESNKLFQNSLTAEQAGGELFRQDVLGEPKSQGRFEQLSSDEQARLKGVYETTLPEGRNSPQPMVGFGQPGAEPPTQEQREAIAESMKVRQKNMDANATRDGLVQLLDSGKLQSTDKNGDSLLSNLDRLRTQEFAEEGSERLDGNTVLGDVIKQTADPGLIRQGSKGTCVPTSLEFVQARNQPAEYARVVAGLTSKEGTVELKDGTNIARDHNLVAEDGSGRSSASRVYQASMMEFANGSLDYRNEEDQHFRNNWFGVSEPVTNNDGKPSRGLYPSQSEVLGEALFGKNFETHRGPHRGGGEQWKQDISGALEGEKVVRVGMRWSRNPDDRDGYHSLTVEKMDDKHVYLRNPWGAGEAGNQDESRASGPIREALRPDGPALGQDQVFGGMMGGMMGGGGAPQSDIPTGEAGMLRMTREEFASNLSSYMVEQ